MGIEAGAAQEVERAAVKVVGAALGHRVHHAAHGAAVFRRDIRRHHLKLLHRVRRDLRLDARAAGVLVVELLGVVVAVEQERVVARHAAEGQQAESGVVGHAGRIQHERVDAAAVDRQVHDVARADHLRNVGFRVFKKLRGRVHVHRRGGLADRQRNVQVHVLADLKIDVLGFVGGESGGSDGHFVTGSRQQRGRRKNPGRVGRIERTSPCDAVEMTTFALGTTAPLGSCTVPEIPPCPATDCAHIRDAAAMDRNTATTSFFCIVLPPCSFDKKLSAQDGILCAPEWATGNGSPAPKKIFSEKPLPG